MKGKKVSAGTDWNRNCSGNGKWKMYIMPFRASFTTQRRDWKKAGLPDVNYIEIRNGVVYWNDEIKVQEDATEFDQIYNRIKHEKNRIKR